MGEQPTSTSTELTSAEVVRPLNREEAMARAEKFFQDHVARLSEKQLRAISTKEDRYDRTLGRMVQVDSGKSVKELIYEASLIKAGINLENLTVGNLTAEEREALFRGQEGNVYSSDLTIHVLRQGLISAARLKMLHAAYAKDAPPALLEDFHQRDPRGDFPIGISDEQLQQRADEIDQIRKRLGNNILVITRTEEELQQDWPNERKKLVQQNLGLTDEEIQMLVQYKIYTPDIYGFQIKSRVAPILGNGRILDDNVPFEDASDTARDEHMFFAPAVLIHGNQGLRVTSEDGEVKEFKLPRKHRTIFNQWALLGSIRAEEVIKGKIPLEKAQRSL